MHFYYIQLDSGGNELRREMTKYYNLLGEVMYRQPGGGAVDFARNYTDGLDQTEALSVIQRLLVGELQDENDKRLKRCGYCGYYWRDESLRNTRKTCCEDCKRGIKTLQRREQRARQALLHPEKRRTTRDDYYDFFEYPFWLSEKSMFAYDSNYISDVEEPEVLIEFIDAKNKIYGEGNRKVNTSNDGL